MPRSSPTSKVPDNPQRLLDAALMAFNEAGIQGASIQAICRAAGASIGSAYHHYGSKLGLAEALYVHGMDAHLQQLAAQLRSVRSPRAVVRALIRCLLVWVEQNPAQARFIYANSIELQQRRSAKLLALRERWAALLGPHLSELQHRAQQRKLPVELLQPLLLGPSHDLARRWLEGAVARPPSDFAEMLAKVAWQSLDAPAAPVDPK